MFGGASIAGGSVVISAAKGEKLGHPASVTGSVASELGYASPSMRAAFAKGGLVPGEMFVLSLVTA